MRIGFVTLAILALTWDQASWARCGGQRDNADTSGLRTRCIRLPDLIPAVATAEEADRLRDQLASHGEEAILQNCKSGSGDKTKVTEISGTMCGPNAGPAKVCYFRTHLECAFEGKTFDMEVQGGCGHRGSSGCGTFDSCARDKRIETNEVAFTPIDGRSGSKRVPPRADGGVR